jgi:hypothetical protein
VGKHKGPLAHPLVVTDWLEATHGALAASAGGEEAGSPAVTALRRPLRPEKRHCKADGGAHGERGGVE